MGYASLFSGGKDSALATWMASRDDIDIEYIVTVEPIREDSYMFHKPNLHLVPRLAESMDIELIKIKTEGEKEKELEDLKHGLDKIEIDGLIIGAVASNYQMQRIESLAREKGLEVYAPLWNIDQKKILERLLEDNLETVIVSVAARGLDESWLGRKIDRECINDLMELKEDYGINVAGEGGEYETLVLDMPLFSHGFKIVNGKKGWDGKRGSYHIEKITRT